MAPATAMIDSGVTTIFINKWYVVKKNIRQYPLERPILLRNADNSANAIGQLTHTVRLKMKMEDHIEDIVAHVADIGDDDVIIGVDWLRHHNPNIDWTKGEISLLRCPKECAGSSQPVLERGAKKPRSAAQGKSMRVAAKTTISQQIAEKTALKEGQKTVEELVPAEFLKGFEKVYSKKASERMPERKPWDHAIDLVPGAPPPWSKIYPLPPAEQKAIKEFLEENLRKGYIRASKSPAAAGTFTVKKKDGAPRICVDY